MRTQNEVTVRPEKRPSSSADPPTRVDPRLEDDDEQDGEDGGGDDEHSGVHFFSSSGYAAHFLFALVLLV